MLSNVRIFLHRAKVNVLENLLNISLTASAECVLLLHQFLNPFQKILSSNCNYDKLYSQGTVRVNIYFQTVFFFSFLPAINAETGAPTKYDKCSTRKHTQAPCSQHFTDPQKPSQKNCKIFHIQFDTLFLIFEK